MPIINFVGAPLTGKTVVARTIARAAGPVIEPGTTPAAIRSVLNTQGQVTVLIDDYVPAAAEPLDLIIAAIEDISSAGVNVCITSEVDFPGHVDLTVSLTRHSSAADAFARDLFAVTG